MKKFNKLLLSAVIISIMAFMHACSVESGKNDGVTDSFTSKLLKKPKIADNESDLSFMKNAGGKYPHEIKLFENEAFNSRLKNLLADDYQIFVDWWAVEEPIKEIRPGIYWAEACKAHECAFIDFALYIDTREDYIVAGMNTDRGVELYTEKPKLGIPKAMTDWAEIREQ